jgi:putative spermidine/putrescine transport system permease protein
MENRQWGWWLLYLFGALVIFFMVLPSLIVIPMSFSDSIMMKFPPDTFSLRWYRAFFSKPEWTGAFWLSLKLGLGVMGLSTLFGVLAAIGLVRGRFPGRELIRGFLISPMIVPVVVTALAMYYFYAELKLTGNSWSLLFSHTCMATPIVMVIVSATLQNLNPNLEKAAQMLGATPCRTFFQIVLPIIRPGVIVGGLFAFILSFDEVVIAAFIGGYRSATLPKRMFENVRDEMDPTVAAISTVLVLISIILLLIVGRLNRRAQRLK